MISEGSCDWSNDAENEALIKGINYIFKYIQIENSYWNSKTNLQYHCFCCILDQINAGLVSRREFFKKNLLVKNFWLEVYQNA